MPTINEVMSLLEDLAPLRLAEEWDNVGLLVGDRTRPAARIVTCLTLTEQVAAEAVNQQADLVITHHPLPFRPLSHITTDDAGGRTLWQLMQAGVSVVSLHTAFDSAAEGINYQLATALGLSNIVPLIPDATDPKVGSGRVGDLSAKSTIDQLAAQVGKVLKLSRVRIAESNEKPATRVAIACGSGGSLLDAAIACHANVLVTGEASFHSLLAAGAEGVSVVLTGHYASERFAMEWLAEWLATKFPKCQVWASKSERDPLRDIEC